MSIISASTDVSAAGGRTAEQELRHRLGRELTAMDGLHVIEIRNAGQPAWLMEPIEHVSDSITFDFEKAHVFFDFCHARDTVSRLCCGYPQWHCVAVYCSEEYRITFARELRGDPSLLAPINQHRQIATDGAA